MSKIIKPKNEVELNYVIKNSKACIVDFYGDGGPPCKQLGKYLEEVVEKNKYENISFVKIDCSDNAFEKTIDSHDISSIPRILGYKKGSSYFYIT